jgi:hypothetical protein
MSALRLRQSADVRRRRTERLESFMVVANEVSTRPWWDGVSGENFWLEATDRDDIGTDLKAPLADEAGRSNWRYDLFRSAVPGDVVFHYDKKVGAIASVSRIKGPSFEAPIVWAARGNYARQRGAVPSEVPGYRIPLVNHRILQRPLTLDALRAARSDLEALYGAIPSRGARYFPFELSARPVRLLQGYAFKLPANFVAAFPELREAASHLEPVARSELEIFREAVGAIEVAAPGYAIGRLQALRARNKGLRRSRQAIFGNRLIENPWIFHWGGREELQFNLGIDRFPNGTPAFRAGVAFSFEPSRSLPDIDVLLPKVARFNQFLREHSEMFANLSMWHWQNGVRSEDYRVSPIPERLVCNHTFVFMGERQVLTSIDAHSALRTFDQLFPVYRWVEGDGAPITTATATAAEVTAIAEVLDLEAGRIIDGGRWISATTRERTLDIFLRHLELQRRLREELMREGAQRVVLEARLGSRSIDAVADFGGELWFYEVKTASSARACLREAIGQLLEYALWRGATHPAHLVVVGEAPLDAEAEQYLAALNTRFPFPLAYRCLSL